MPKSTRPPAGPGAILSRILRGAASQASRPFATAPQGKARAPHKAPTLRPNTVPGKGRGR